LINVNYFFPSVLPHERILPEKDSCLFLNLTDLDQEYTAIPCAEQVCYTFPTHPEDKALLESNLSAKVGKQTDGQGTTLPFLCVPSMHRSLEVQVLYPT
jgi:hypothetical protein